MAKVVVYSSWATVLVGWFFGPLAGFLAGSVLGFYLLARK